MYYVVFCTLRFVLCVFFCVVSRCIELLYCVLFLLLRLLFFFFFLFTAVCFVCIATVPVWCVGGIVLCLKYCMVASIMFYSIVCVFVYRVLFV